MYPLEAGERVKTFCLLRSTQTCCYGPRPQYNQYILVEAKTPARFARLAPVLVSGRFFVDPKPDEGYVYRMEDASVRAVDEDAPETDAASAARQAHLPLFDFAPLLGLAGRPAAPALPDALQAAEGKTVVVTGYCVDRTRDDPPGLIVSNAWWDGVAKGKPPTVFNSVIVRPADRQQVPPLWKPHQTFTGTLRVTRDAARWPRDGIVQLADAQLGVPGVTAPLRAPGGRPWIPWPVEALVLAGIVCASLGRRRAGPEAEEQESE